MTLAELRERDTVTRMEIQQLEDKIEDRTKAAHKLAAQARSKAQLGHDVSEEAADLRGLNGAHLADTKRLEQLREELTLNALRIRARYEAVRAGNERLDWTAELVPGSLYSQWGGGQRKEGTWLVTATELCETELKLLRELTGIKHLLLNVHGDRYRLHGRYPAYRGTCWSDHGGEELAKKLEPLFGTHQEVLAELEGLEVLGVRV